MPFLFLPPEFFLSNEPVITGEKARYLSKVLRLKSGELITLFDGQGNRYVAKCIKFSNKEVFVSILDRTTASVKSSSSLILAQGMLKGQKMDFVIQKATELGVDKIYPLITERTEVRTTARHLRWKQIAQSASEQCGRLQIPEIETPIELKDFVKQYSSGILFWEGQAVGSLKEVLKRMARKEWLILLLGPEGGFSEAEVLMAKSHQYQPASLGPRILRSETASIAALSIVQYELGDISS